MSKKDTCLARLNPYDPKRGALKQNYALLSGDSKHVKFEAGNWYRVKLSIARFLETVRQIEEDPDSKLAFTFAKNRKEADQIEKRERLERERERAGIRARQKPKPDITADDLLDTERVYRNEDDDATDELDELDETTPESTIPAEGTGEDADDGVDLDDMSSKDEDNVPDLAGLDRWKRSKLVKVAGELGLQVEKSMTVPKLRKAIRQITGYDD